MNKSKKDFKDYERITLQKFDWEDKKAKIFNKIQELRREDLHCSQQLRIVEDQLRLFFGRIRIELKKDDEK